MQCPASRRRNQGPAPCFARFFDFLARFRSASAFPSACPRPIRLDPPLLFVYFWGKSQTFCPEAVDCPAGAFQFSFSSRSAFSSPVSWPVSSSCLGSLVRARSLPSSFLCFAFFSFVSSRLLVALRTRLERQRDGESPRLGCTAATRASWAFCNKEREPSPAHFCLLTRRQDLTVCMRMRTSVRTMHKCVRVPSAKPYLHVCHCMGNCRWRERESERFFVPRRLLGDSRGQMRKDPAHLLRETQICAKKQQDCLVCLERKFHRFFQLF